MLYVLLLNQGPFVQTKECLRVSEILTIPPQKREAMESQDLSLPTVVPLRVCCSLLCIHSFFHALPYFCTHSAVQLHPCFVTSLLHHFRYAIVHLWILLLEVQIVDKDDHVLGRC